MTREETNARFDEYNLQHSLGSLNALYDRAESNEGVK